MPIVRYVLDVNPLWNTEASFTEALHVLPESNHAKIKKYHFLEDKKLSLGSALLQRMLVMKYLPGLFSSLDTVQIPRDDMGRPYPPPNPTPSDPNNNILKLEDFNTTHHSPRLDGKPNEKVLVCVAARLSTSPKRAEEKYRIGVDIVPTRHRPSDAASWVKNFNDAGVYTPYELKWINSFPTDLLKARAMKLNWSFKEAFTKATGWGLSADFGEIEFRELEMYDVGENPRTRWRGGKLYHKGVEKPEWVFENHKWDSNFPEGGEGFYFAVAAEREGLEGEDLDGEREMGGFVEVDYLKDILEPYGDVFC